MINKINSNYLYKKAPKLLDMNYTPKSRVHIWELFIVPAFGKLILQNNNKEKVLKII